MKAVAQAARWIHLALERGGKVLMVLPEHPVERETVRSRIKTMGAGMRVVPIVPKRDGDEFAGRSACRRLDPRAEDLLFVPALRDVTAFVVGILKEANMWHTEPIVFTDGPLPRKLKALCDVKVSVRNLTPDLFDQRRVTKLIPFALRDRRKAVSHKPTGSLNTH